MITVAQWLRNLVLGMEVPGSNADKFQMVVSLF